MPIYSHPRLETLNDNMYESLLRTLNGIPGVSASLSEKTIDVNLNTQAGSLILVGYHLGKHEAFSNAASFLTEKGLVFDKGKALKFIE